MFCAVRWCGGGSTLLRRIAAIRIYTFCRLMHTRAHTHTLRPLCWLRSVSVFGVRFVRLRAPAPAPARFAHARHANTLSHQLTPHDRPKLAKPLNYTSRRTHTYGEPSAAAAQNTHARSHTHTPGVRRTKCALVDLRRVFCAEHRLAFASVDSK